MPERLTIDTLLDWNDGRMPEPSQPNNLQSALALYAQNEKCMASFEKSHKRISRQLTLQFSETVAASALRQANAISRKFIGYGYKPNKIINDLYNHQTIVDHLFFNFGQILRECNAYMNSLEKYHDFLCDKCEKPAEMLSQSPGLPSLAHSQMRFSFAQHYQEASAKDKAYPQKTPHEIDGQMSNPQRNIADKRKAFQDKIAGLEASTSRNCSGLILLCADQDMKTVEQTYENVHHLMEYCQGVTINLDELRTHLRVHLPVYLNAANLANTVKSMDKALNQMGMLTAQVFESYTSGYDFAQRLYHQMPAVTTLAGMEMGFNMKNQSSAAALRSSSHRIQQELLKRGYGNG